MTLRTARDRRVVNSFLAIFLYSKGRSMAIGRSGKSFRGRRTKHRSHRTGQQNRERRRQLLHEPLEHRLLLSLDLPPITGIIGGLPGDPVLEEGEMLLRSFGGLAAILKYRQFG